MPTKTIVSFYTAKVLMGELIEHARAFEKQYERMLRTDKDSEKMLDILNELSIEAMVIEMKSQDCKIVADELIDAFPD